MNDTSDFKKVTVIPIHQQEKQFAADDRVHLVVMTGSNVGEVFTLGTERLVLGREDSVDIQLMDADVSRFHAEVTWDPDDMLYRLRDLDSSNGTRINDAPVKGEREIRRGDKIQLGHHSVLRVSFGDEIETAYARQMYQAVLRDGLTGAYNRRYFDDRLATEVSFTQRHANELSLIMFDIDHFKRINDTYGHPTGDAILKLISEMVRSLIRSEDVFARYGGEEFAIISRGASEEGAAILAERLRHQLSRREYMIEEHIVAVSASFGVAQFSPGGLATAQALVEAADQALYEAKRSGRDRVCAFSKLAQ